MPAPSRSSGRKPSASQRKASLTATPAPAGQDTPDSSESANVSPSHEEIAACAYRIWVSEGCPEGHDAEHWLRAEAQVRGHR